MGGIHRAVSNFQDGVGTIAQTFDSRDTARRDYMDVLTACLSNGASFIPGTDQPIPNSNLQK